MKFDPKSASPAMLAVILGFAAFGAASAAEPFIYPAKGQKPAQQDKDKTECRSWASGQTGFDPVQALRDQQARDEQASQQASAIDRNAAEQANRGKGAAAGGTVKGAVVGTAIGAVAGDAGKGAAIGATTGAVAGVGAKRRAQASAQQEQNRQQQQVSDQQALQQAAAKQQLADYDRAFQACMEGRGYTVK